MRDRLIELLDKTFEEQYEKRGLLTAQHTADDLLANGVILIPCNVGHTVYTIFEGKIETLEITQAKTEENKNGFRIDCLAENDFLRMSFSKCHIGNSIFLTEEEAEAKLKERVGNG